MTYFQTLFTLFHSNKERHNTDGKDFNFTLFISLLCVCALTHIYTHAHTNRENNYVYMVISIGERICELSHKISVNLLVVLNGITYHLPPNPE